MDHYLGTRRSLSVKGDAAQRAYEQGHACASQYASAAACIGSLVIEPGRLLRPALHTRASQAGLTAAGAYYLARHRSALRSFDGGSFWRAQRGLADGSGLPLSLSFGLGAVPELVGSQLGYSLGCSAVAVARVEGERGPQIFYNHDFPPRFGRYSFVRHNAPSDGHASVCLTYPIMVGCLAGVNEPGLAITLNHAFAKDYHGRAGILLTSLVQACLDRASDVASALELVRSAPVTNGAILTLADRGGARAIAEISCTALRVRHPTELVAKSFNHYQHPEMVPFEIPLNAVSTGLVAGIRLHESNIARAARWEELLPCPPETIGQADLRRIMTDHGANAAGLAPSDRRDPNTICRHGDPLSETLWSAVLSPDRRTIDVAFGHACEGRPVRYDLARETKSTASHAASAALH